MTICQFKNRKYLVKTKTKQNKYGDFFFFFFVTKEDENGTYCICRRSGMFD